MKVLFINDSTSSSNWGDRAAAISLRAMIGQCGGEITHAITEESLWHASFGAPSSNVPASPSGRASREKVKLLIPPVVLQARHQVLSRRPDDGPEQLIPEAWDDFEVAAAKVCREQRYGWPAVLRAVDDADVAVIHGASLHSHGVTIIQRTDLFLTYLIKTRFGKPVVITNHTADLGNAALRRIAEHVYPLFDDVVYRDSISADRWASVLGGRFAADTAFWFEPAPRETWALLAGRPTYFDVWPDTAAFDPSGPYLCVGGSSIFHERKDWESVVNGYSALIQHLRSVYSGTIVLTASADLDQPVFRELAERFDLPLIGVTTPVQQVVDILGNADAYIGGRWHASIFALRGGTPLLALSSQTFKMQALAGMAGSSPATFDALALGSEAHAVGRYLSQTLEQGGELRAKLRAWADEMAENSWDNVAFLRRHQREHGSEPARGL